MDEIASSNVKPFDDLETADVFMFGAVVSASNNLKPLIEIVLGVIIARATYPKLQKTIAPADDGGRVGLDVYREDVERSVHAVEIQTTNRKNLSKSNAAAKKVKVNGKWRKEQGIICQRR